ncbi:MAG: helix-turn-helix transcriptional regulator [Chloroflexi bacterium]|nr:helix-turn-helix transcriptional regulator [Chloroflexota bacterium]
MEDRVKTIRTKHAHHWLSVRRRELGISQDELAVRLQIAGLDFVRSTISNWERGRANPPLDDPEFRRVLANVLELTLDDLLQRGGYIVKQEEVPEDEVRLVVIYRQLSKQEKQFLLNMAVEILKKEQANNQMDR